MYDLMSREDIKFLNREKEGLEFGIDDPRGTYGQCFDFDDIPENLNGIIMDDFYFFEEFPFDEADFFDDFFE